MRIIFLNGPPRSGKDFAAKVLGGRHLKISRALKEMTHSCLGIIDGLNRPVAHDFFEKVKDEKVTAFGQRTPREAYIQMSEGFLKPLYGEGILGRLLLPQLHADCLFVISDSGFRAEAEEIVRHVGAEHCLLVRIHRDGYTFDGDSRGYISLSDLGVREEDVHNDGGASFTEILRAL